jgi:hypothetical protein
MVPTAVATCAALGEGGSPSGVSLATLCFGQIELICATKTNIMLPEMGIGPNKLRKRK